MASLRAPCPQPRDSATLAEWPSALVSHSARSDVIHHASSLFSTTTPNQQVVTDKNSWALGGTIAATQTSQSFMNGAADKIATEARKLAR